MKNCQMSSFLMTLVLFSSFSAVKPAWSSDDLQLKVDSLAQEVEQLKAKIQTQPGNNESSAEPSWLTIGGDLRVRHDTLKGKTVAFTQMAVDSLGNQSFTSRNPATIKNDSLLTNRFGLNLKANVAEGVKFKARLVMEKAFGSSGSETWSGSYFSDRMQAFDGTSGHYPNGNTMYLDYAYADINNILDQPIWFSAGRRPSASGAPTNLRRNEEASGVAGVMGLLTDYAFDGFTLGVAPGLEKLPGFATKLCYGRAFQMGYKNFATQSSLRNTDMLGVVVIPLETDNTRVEAQYQRGFDIMNTIPGPNVTLNLGDLEDYGIGISHVFRNIGLGDLNMFVHGAMSQSHANNNTFLGSGLLYNGTPKDNKGYAYYVGTRYDFTPTRTKLGFEYNHGSQYWQNFTPAADDVWTSKLGTRGSVYETYAIQELSRYPNSPNGKVFFRLGYQYYDFDYTGSNNWVGVPSKISDITASSVQMLTPVKNAYDLYATFDVHF